MTRTAKTKTVTPAPTPAIAPPRAQRAAKATKALTAAPPAIAKVEPVAPPNPDVPPRPAGKLGVLVDLLRRPHGASVHDLAEATGWQIHSVRGAMAGALRQRGFVVVSDKPAELRIYRIEPPPKRSARKGRSVKAT